MLMELMADTTADRRGRDELLQAWDLRLVCDTRFTEIDGMPGFVVYDDGVEAYDRCDRPAAWRLTISCEVLDRDSNLPYLACEECKEAMAGAYIAIAPLK